MLITMAIVRGLILLTVFVAFSAITGAPIAFFFPAYTAIYFFAGRYAALGRIVFLAPPAPPVPPPVCMPAPPASGAA